MAHTVMVTGADGFIGSHLTEELVKKGEKVKAFCYYNSFNSCGWIDSLAPEIRSEIEIFMGDIRDPNGVRTAMQGQERVFHLAALIAIPFSYHSPDSYVDTNIKGTLNVLQAAAFALKNMLGLTCDPVGGLVEVPCIKRNVAGVVNAISAAQLAMAGIVSAISPDDTIDSMRRIGNELPVCLKETGMGGLAVTESAKKIMKKMLNVTEMLKID